MMQLKNIPRLVKLTLKKVFKEEFTNNLEENNTIKIMISDLTNIVCDFNNSKKEIDEVKENVNIINQINDSFSKDIVSLKKENENLKKENLLLKSSFVSLAKDMSLISEALSQIFSLSNNIEVIEEEYNIEDDFEEKSLVKKKNKKKIYH